MRIQKIEVQTIFFTGTYGITPFLFLSCFWLLQKPGKNEAAMHSCGTPFFGCLRGAPLLHPLIKPHDLAHLKTKHEYLFYNASKLAKTIFFFFFVNG
jgi:hypothetical protein